MFTTPSFWEKEVLHEPVDVLIVGGGLLGLWTACELRLLKPSLRIRILEAHAFPQGASTRNAGFACFGSPTELLHDVQTIGTDKMLQVVEWRYKGIRKMLQVMAGTDIGYEACGGYECLTAVPPDFEAQLQQLNQQLLPITGDSKSFSLTDQRFGMHQFEAVVFNSHEGCQHSGRLIKALTARVQEMGVQIVYGMPVKSWTKHHGGWQLQAGGRMFTAGQVVFATNAGLSQQFPSLGIKPARGQVLVTKPIPGLQLKGTFHFDEGFYYWRHLPGNRILLGGARNADLQAEETLEPETSLTVQVALQQFLMTHYPQHFQPQNVASMIEHRWSGLMAMSADKLPLLQAIDEDLYAAMCCNGMGVALAPVFAETIANTLLTKS